MLEINLKNLNINDMSFLSLIIGNYITPNSFILLSGELGSGKTTFSREMIKSIYAIDQVCDSGLSYSTAVEKMRFIKSRSSNLDITSPTFNIFFNYKNAHVNINHYDFYRISEFKDLIEIGFLEDVKNSINLIEWPKFTSEFICFDKLDKDTSMKDIKINVQRDGLQEIMEVFSEYFSKNKSISGFLTEIFLEIPIVNQIQSDDLYRDCKVKVSKLP